MLLIPQCDRQTDTHTERHTHDDGIYRTSIASCSKKIYTAVSCCRLYATGSLWLHGVSLKSACFRSSVDPTDRGLLIISNLPWSIWLSFVLRRRFDQAPHAGTYGVDMNVCDDKMRRSTSFTLPDVRAAVIKGLDNPHGTAAFMTSSAWSWSRKFRKRYWMDWATGVLVAYWGCAYQHLDQRCSSFDRQITDLLVATSYCDAGHVHSGSVKQRSGVCPTVCLFRSSVTALSSTL